MDLSKYQQQFHLPPNKETPIRVPKCKLSFSENVIIISSNSKRFFTLPEQQKDISGVTENQAKNINQVLYSNLLHIIISLKLKDYIFFGFDTIQLAIKTLNKIEF